MNAVSCRGAPYGMNLPCGMNRDQEKVKHVCNVVKELLSKEKK